MKKPLESWRGLADRERRTVVVASLVLASTVLALRVVPGVLRFGVEARQQAAAAAMTLDRARTLVASEGALRESLAVRATELVALAPRLFAGETPNEAAADLSSHVSGLADRNRIRVVRQDARPDSTEGPFTRLTMRLEAEGDIAGVTSWLAALEEGEKLITIESLSLSAPEASSSASAQEKIRIDFTVEAWATRVDP